VSSAIWPLQELLYGVLTADVTLAPLLAGGKVYSGRAPETAPLDYIILGQSIETPEYLFGDGGHRNIERLHVWTDDVSKYRAAMIVAELERILHGTPLTLNGHDLVTGAFSTISILPDASGRYTQAVCQYEALSYEYTV
jgi:hypothetical protein